MEVGRFCVMCAGLIYDFRKMKMESFLLVLNCIKNCGKGSENGKH